MDLESTIKFIRIQLSKAILVKTQNIQDEEANILLQQDMERQSALIPWNWVCVHFFDLIAKYPGGLSQSVLLNELQLRWDENGRDWYKETLQKTETIEGLYDKKIPTKTSVLEGKVTKVQVIPQTQTFLVTITNPPNKFDKYSKQRSIEIYLHQKFYQLIKCDPPILTEGVDIRLTMIRVVRSDSTKLDSDLRLLPSEYFTIILPSPIISQMLSDPNSTIASGDFLIHEFSRFRFPETSYTKFVATVMKIEDFVTISTSNSNSPSSNNLRSKRQCVHLQVIQHSKYSKEISQEKLNIALMLWDDQTTLTSLFKKGDYVVIWNPRVNPYLKETIIVDSPIIPGAFIEYSFDTILLVSPNEPLLESLNLSGTESSSNLSQFKVPKNEGLFDMKHIPERIFIRELVTPNMMNVFLLGRVAAVGANVPHYDEADVFKRIDRFPLRISDPSGIIDITCFDSIGKFQAAPLRVGQFVFIEGVSVLENSKNKNKPYIACKPNYKGKIHCISMLPGLLNSPALYKPLQLMNSSSQLNFVCKATITKVIPISTPVITIHSICKNKVVRRSASPPRLPVISETVYHCSMCAEDLELGQIEQSFNFVYEIDDSTAVLKVTATHSAHKSIISFTASEAEAMTKTQLDEKLQLHVLNVQDFIFSVSKCTDPQTPQAQFRIDQVVQPNALWECQYLLSLKS